MIRRVVLVGGVAVCGLVCALGLAIVAYAIVEDRRGYP